MTAVDIDAKVTRPQSGQRAEDGALKFVVRCARADRFAHGKRHERPDAKRRRERESVRSVFCDGMDIERHDDAYHAVSFCSIPRSRLPTRSTVVVMSQLGSIPPETLADAVEKHVSKMDEATLASLVAGGIETMPLSALRALVAAVFAAFRDRGESSDDAAEGSHAQLERLEAGDRDAVRALVSYANENTALLKEALIIFAREHSSEISALPKALVDAISERLHA